MTMAASQETDSDLLRRFARERSEEAFSELVRRHLDLVHSAARRQVEGDEDAAADVTQAVFLELARQASRLAEHPALVGWLFTTTHRIASRWRRDERRRHRREHEAQRMQTLLHHGDAEPEADWSRIAPVLDAAMNELPDADRLALLLRYFERRPLSEVGAWLGLRENAARMRVERALDKLRIRLKREGVVSSAAALSLALSGSAVGTAPPALAAGIVSSALAVSAALPISVGIWTLMTSTKLKLTGIAAVTLLGIPWVYEHQQRRELALQNERLLGQLEQTRQELQGVRAEVGRLTTDQEDSRALRAEVLRLRGERAQPKPGVERRSIPLPPSGIPPEPEVREVRPFQAKIQASVPAGSSLLTGGWTISPGRRAFVLLSPAVDASNPDAPQVAVQPMLFDAPEEQWKALGLGVNPTEDGGETPKKCLSNQEVKELVERLQATAKVDLLSAPTLSTLSGRQAQLFIGGEESPSSISFDLVPTVTEGMGVDLSFQMEVQASPGPGQENKP